ncbi:MAG: glycoside hydrolase family 2 TIM barrel-domain containing protein [Bryobacteraceae bacterium]
MRATTSFLLFFFFATGVFAQSSGEVRTSRGQTAPGSRGRLASSNRGGRVIVLLDGTWQVADSVSATDVPSSFDHTAPVPGLADLAVPAFPDVDKFDSRETLRRNMRTNPQVSIQNVAVGIPRQNRNYFWYRTTFRAPVKKAFALLKVNKAQFGMAVWLNGKKIGEHLGCFDPGYFDLTAAMHWDGDNDVIVRIGAHPAVLPETVPAGTDSEKVKWTPGIYDSVAVFLCDNPVIESIQVAPRIAGSEILIETRIKNYGPAASFQLTHRVTTWKGAREVARSGLVKLSLKAGEEIVRRDVIKIPGATLWTPENPFLYVVETSTGGDSVSTRFGMREFRFDTATQRAYLNGKVYFLRGSNITLHRFFEDKECGRLPWDDKWVRGLLIDVPKKMHWNSFRFCIGPVPDKWLDIADEAGLLIQYEFAIWGYHQSWDANELIAEFKGWMQDNWNHPSVAFWDTCNETTEATLGDKVIPAVRNLDLSNRQWENGYNLPNGPDDPVEIHPYLGNYKMTDLETMNGFDRTAGRHTSAHARILNEYGNLELNRDGSPTGQSRTVFEKIVGPNATPEQRFDIAAYLMAGETEFWRAHRAWAAIMHFVYLTVSYPGGVTSDNFLDVKNLKLEPHFEDYMGEAFKPLGVYINFWQPTLPADSTRRFLVMTINDDAAPVEGKLALSLESSGGQEVARQEVPFSIGASGQSSYNVELKIPKVTGDCLLKATATPSGGRLATSTMSRRRVSIQ